MIDDEAIRKIIREELRRFLLAIVDATHEENGYETEHIESAALSTISQVAKREIELLPHNWDCEKRSVDWRIHRCSCGIETKPYVWGQN